MNSDLCCISNYGHNEGDNFLYDCYSGMLLNYPEQNDRLFNTYEKVDHIFFLFVASNLTLIRRQDCEDINAPQVSNIGYVLTGYDIFFGNPLATEQLADPGIRQPIFQAEYKGATTQDSRYCIPEGMSVLSCRGN